MLQVITYTIIWTERSEIKDLLTIYDKIPTEEDNEKVDRK